MRISHAPRDAFGELRFTLRWTNANVLLRRQRLSPPRHAPVGFAHGGRHAIPLPVPPVGCHTMPSPALSSSGARAAAELALLVDNSPTLRARAARAVATETPSAWRIARPRLPAPAQPTNSPCSWTTAPRRRRRPAKGPGRSRCRRRNSFGLAHCARVGLGGGPTRGPRDDHDLLRAPRRLSINFQFVGIAMSLVSRAANSCAFSFLLSPALRCPFCHTFVVSKRCLVCAYQLSFRRPRGVARLLGQRHRVRHKLAYRRPRGVVCSLEERHRLRLFSFRFVGIAMLLVFLGQRPRARHRFSYSQPRGVVCRLGKRPFVRLSAFVFVGLAVLHVSSGSGIVCAISFLIASLAVSSVFSDGGLVCAYQLSESIPYELVRGADFSPLRRQLLSKFCLVKGVLFLARRRLHDQRL